MLKNFLKSLPKNRCEFQKNLIIFNKINSKNISGDSNNNQKIVEKKRIKLFELISNKNKSFKDDEEENEDEKKK